MAQQVIDRRRRRARIRRRCTRSWPTARPGPSGRPSAPSTLIEPGDGTPEGLGRGPPVHHGPPQEPRAGRACRPGQVFAYVLEAGLPLRDYKAVVTLTPAAGGAPPSTGARPSGPRCPAPAGSTAASWASSSGGPSRGWPRRADRARQACLVLAVVAGCWRRLGAVPRRPRGARRPGGAGRGTRAGPARPRRGGPAAPRAGRRGRRWPGGPGTAGGGLREVDGGQLEEPVAVVGHHDLGRRVGQLGPHGVDLGLGRRLLLGERLVTRRSRDVGVARRVGGRRGGVVPLLLGEMLARRCPQAAHAGTLCSLTTWKRGPH